MFYKCAIATYHTESDGRSGADGALKWHKRSIGGAELSVYASLRPSAVMLAAAASWLARLAVEAVGWRRRADGLVGGRAGGRLQWSGGCRSALNLEGRFLERFPGLGADAEHARVVSALVAKPREP